MLTREAAGILANVQEKWTHNSGEMPWNRGDPSIDVCLESMPFYCKEKDLILFRHNSLPCGTEC